MNRLLALLFLSAISSASSVLQIVPPYPSNPVVLEGEPLTITCSAEDSAAFPNVYFQKVGKDGVTYKEINQTSGRVYITYVHRNDTAKGLLTTTAALRITKAHYPDDGDSSGLSYKCLTSALVLATKELTFTVYVVRKIDLPRAVVKSVTTTTYGGPVNLTCDVTYKGNPSTVKLEKVVWIRNSMIIGQGSDAVDPITITKATTRDGGDYVCGAEVKLMTTKTKKITMGTAKLHVKLKLFNGTTPVIGKVSGNAFMECPAEGYPLNVTWMRVNKDGHEVSIGEIPRFRGRYSVTRPCPWCRYRLTIYNLQSHDQGHYVCKATSNMESARYHGNLEIQEDEKIVQTTTTPTTDENIVQTTTTSTTEPTLPKKPSVLPWVIYIVMGIVVLLSLLLNGCLCYKLKVRNKDTILESGEPRPTPPTKKNTSHDVVETIKEVPEPDDEENPTSIELEPLITNHSTDENEEDLEPEAPKQSAAEPKVPADEHKGTDTEETQPTVDVPVNPSLEKVQDGSGDELCDCDFKKIKIDPAVNSKKQPIGLSNDPGSFCILS